MLNHENILREFCAFSLAPIEWSVFHAVHKFAAVISVSSFKSFWKFLRVKLFAIHMNGNFGSPSFIEVKINSRTRAYFIKKSTSINSIWLFFFHFWDISQVRDNYYYFSRGSFFFIVYGTLKNLCNKKVKNFLTSLICRGVHGNYFSFHFVLADSNRHSLQSLWRQTSEVKIRLPACF